VATILLSWEQVDRWAKTVIEEVLTVGSVCIPPVHDHHLLMLEEQDVKKNPCASHWTNMVNEITARMWGIFDETGIFLALC
jgi:hypothetical protein